MEVTLLLDASKGLLLRKAEYRKTQFEKYNFSKCERIYKTGKYRNDNKLK
jgi:hypothetical protein